MHTSVTLLLFFLGYSKCFCLIFDFTVDIKALCLYLLRSDYWTNFINKRADVSCHIMVLWLLREKPQNLTCLCLQQNHLRLWPYGRSPLERPLPLTTTNPGDMKGCCSAPPELCCTDIFKETCVYDLRTESEGDDSVIVDSFSCGFRWHGIILKCTIYRDVFHSRKS